MKAPSSIQDLLDELSRLGGDSRVVYTGSGDPEDRYAIIKSPLGWEVFYSERGEQIGLRVFGDEAAACGYVLELLKGYSITWPPLR